MPPGQHRGFVSIQYDVAGSDVIDPKVRIAQEKRRAVEQQKESAAYKTGRMFGALLLASAKSKISNKIVKAMGGSEGILIRQDYNTCFYSTARGVKRIPTKPLKIKAVVKHDVQGTLRMIGKTKGYSPVQKVFYEPQYNVGRCSSKI